MKSIFMNLDDSSEKISYTQTDNIPKPEINNESILVEVKACGLLTVSAEVIRELFKKCPQLHYPAGCEYSGTVTEVGKNVKSFFPGDKVAGIIPLDSSCSGLAEYCICSEFDLVKVGNEVSYENAAAGIGDGVKIFTVLYYMANLFCGESILVTDPLSTWGTLLIQLSKIYQAKVLVLMYNEAKEQPQLQKMDISCIIKCDSNKSIVSSIMEETGGLGVDIIVDNGVRQFNSEEDSKLFSEERDVTLPHKNDLINCLAVRGRWITSQYNLQLDPPHSQQLFMRCASVNFLFDHVWQLSASSMGKYQHILKDVMEKLSNKTLKPKLSKTIPFSEALHYLQHVPQNSSNKGKVIVTF